MGPRRPKTERKAQNLKEWSAAGVTPQGSQSGRTPGGAAEPVLDPTRNLPKRFHQGKIPPRPLSRFRRTFLKFFQKPMIFLRFLYIFALEPLSCIIDLLSSPSSRTRWPKTAPRPPKTPPRLPSDGPRRPQDAPKTAQDGPKTAQDHPPNLQTPVVFLSFLDILALRPSLLAHSSQDGTKMAPRRPKTASRWLQDGPTNPRDRPRWPQDGPSYPQDRPK